MTTSNDTTTTDPTVHGSETAQDFSAFIAMGPVLGRMLNNHPDKVVKERAALESAKQALADAKAASAENLALLDTYAVLVKVAYHGGALTGEEHHAVMTRLQAQYGSGLVLDCQRAVDQAEWRLWAMLARLAKQEAALGA